MYVTQTRNVPSAIVAVRVLHENSYLSGPKLRDIEEANGTTVKNVFTLARTARVSRYPLSPHVDPTLPATVKV